MNLSFKRLITSLAFATGLVSASYAGTQTNYTLSPQNYTASKTRQYSVYEPDNLSQAAPMVMALHGCKQTQNDVLNDWGLKAAADRYGFILVTPFITSYDGLRNENCWGFWFEQERHEGGGEAEDLVSIAKQVEANYSIDSGKRFITGLSSGGAMTAVAAVTHNEYWTAAASVAGLPYGEDSASVSLSGQCPGYATFHDPSRVSSDMKAELNNEYIIPMMVVAGSNDCTVLVQAAYNLRDAHLLTFGSDSFNSENEALATTDDCSPYYQNLYGCKHKRYTTDGSPNGQTIVETVIHNGPTATQNSLDTDHGHYWIGGDYGNEGKWAVRKGPSMPDIIWDFFDRHSGGCGSSCEPIDIPQCSVLGDNPLEVTLNGSFVDPGATCSDLQGSLPVNADCSEVDDNVAGEYTCTYSATNANGSGVTTRLVKVIDPNATLDTCVVISASPSAHISANRAAAGGSYNLRAISNGDNADIGYAYDSWSSVTLTEGIAGSWYAQTPQACQDDPDDPQDPPTGTCTDWYTTNLSHQTAGRAYYSMGYYTTGGNDSLGAVSGIYTWVKEEQSGIYTAGQCP